jgi:hypothetical protein
MKASTAPERRPSTLQPIEGIKIMNTTTFASLNFVRSLLASPATISESAEELFRLADQYEATQPSYADDLRAAASASVH